MWPPIVMGVRLVVLLLFRRDLSNRPRLGLGDCAHSPATFPDVGRPFQPSPQTPRRLRSRLMAIVGGGSRFCGVARGLPRRLPAPRPSPTGEELPPEVPVTRPAAHPYRFLLWFFLSLYSTVIFVPLAFFFWAFISKTPFWSRALTVDVSSSVGISSLSR